MFVLLLLLVIRCVRPDDRGDHVGIVLPDDDAHARRLNNNVRSHICSAATDDAPAAIAATSTGCQEVCAAGSVTRHLIDTRAYIVECQDLIASRTRGHIGGN